MATNIFKLYTNKATKDLLAIYHLKNLSLIMFQIKIFGLIAKKSTKNQ